MIRIVGGRVYTKSMASLKKPTTKFSVVKKGDVTSVESYLRNANQNETSPLITTTPQDTSEGYCVSTVTIDCSAGT